MSLRGTLLRSMKENSCMGLTWAIDWMAMASGFGIGAIVGMTGCQARWSA